MIIPGMMIVRGTIDIWRAIEILSWKKASAIIIESRVSRVGSGPTFKTPHWPTIRYEYFVDGKKFSSDVVAVVRVESYGSSRPQEIVSQYPVGRVIDISYDPYLPSRSVLLGFVWEIPVPLLCGIGLALFFTYFVRRIHGFTTNKNNSFRFEVRQK